MFWKEEWNKTAWGLAQMEIEFAKVWREILLSRDDETPAAVGQWEEI